MSSIEYKHNNGDGYVTELTHTDNQTVEAYGHIPYRHLRLSLSDGQLKNDDTDSETVTIEVVSGLDIARDDSPTVLDYDGDVILSVNGQKTTKSLNNGSLEFDIRTDKPAGSGIVAVAESLANHPAERDSATIEVIQ